MAKKKKISKRRRILNIFSDSLDMLKNGLELTATLPAKDIQWLLKKIHEKNPGLAQNMSNMGRLAGFSENEFIKGGKNPNFDDDLPF